MASFTPFSSSGLIADTAASAGAVLEVTAVPSQSKKTALYCFNMSPSLLQNADLLLSDIKGDPLSFLQDKFRLSL